MGERSSAAKDGAVKAGTKPKPTPAVLDVDALKEVFEQKGIAPIEPRVLNGAQSAAYIGVSYRMLMFYVNTGKIPRLVFPAQDGDDDSEIRKVLVDRRDLDAFIEAKRQKNGNGL